jgi:hypothetical protein
MRTLVGRGKVKRSDSENGSKRPTTFLDLAQHIALHKANLIPP